MYSAQRDRFDNLENNKNLGQKNVQDLNPDQIIAEIDQLEARVRDSKRLLQQERDSVLQLRQVLGPYNDFFIVINRILITVLALIRGAAYA